MKLTCVFLVFLPFVLGADVDRRFIESLLGGVDVLSLANQLLSQFGCDETEAQCEHTLCPQIVNKIDHNNALITGLLCSAVCKEAQVLAKHFTTHGATDGGVDPCTGGGLGLGGLTG